MTPSDKRRLVDGARAMALSPPTDEMNPAGIRAYMDQVGEAIAAMQSLDDLGSTVANAWAWMDTAELCRRFEAAKKRLERAGGSS